GDAAHGGVDGVDGDRVDAILGAVDLGGHVPGAAFHAHFHDQLAALRHRGDVQVGVDDLGVGRYIERCGGYLTGSFCTQHQGDGVFIVKLDDELLEIEDYLHHVFGDALDRRELVQHVFDVYAGDGSAGDRRQQDAPQRVAKGYS